MIRVNSAIPPERRISEELDGTIGVVSAVTQTIIFEKQQSIVAAASECGRAHAVQQTMSERTPRATD